MRQIKERRTRHEIFRDIILAISNQGEQNLYNEKLSSSKTRIQQTTGIAYDKFIVFLDIMIKADLVISNGSLKLTPKAYFLLQELEIMDKVKQRIDLAIKKISQSKFEDLARNPVSTSHKLIDQQQVINTMKAIIEELEKKWIKNF